jgi:molecular chaperone GrpE
MFKQNKKAKHDQKEKPEVKDIKDVEEEIVVEQEGELVQLQKKAEENLNGWKRCQADFENYKKMQAESQKEFVKYAAQNIIFQLIPVLDNFHMSTDHIPEDQKNGGWVTGIMHIQKQLENVLAENGVEEIPTKAGDKFDPAIHEAVEHSDKGNGTGDKVKKILMKGYKTGNKIIRPVKVIVE